MFVIGSTLVEFRTDAVDSSALGDEAMDFRVSGEDGFPATLVDDEVTLLMGNEDGVVMGALSTTIEAVASAIADSKTKVVVDSRDPPSCRDF
jgi:hypothetical protein